MQIQSNSDQWSVCDAGYEIYEESALAFVDKVTTDVLANPGPPLRCIRARSLAPDRMRQYTPHSGLYLQFAALDTTEERVEAACLDFASRFGLLGISPRRSSEPIRRWIQAVGLMQMNILRAISAPHLCEGMEFSHIRARLVPDGGRLVWRMTADSLLEMMSLQFADALARGVAIRECKYCGRWFEAGGEGRRIDAQFCSRAHKVAFHDGLKMQRRKGE